MKLIKISDNEKIFVSTSKYELHRIAIKVKEAKLYIDDDDFFMKLFLDQVLNFKETSLTLNSSILLLVRKDEQGFKEIGVSVSAPFFLATISVFVKEEERRKGYGEMLVTAIKENSGTLKLPLMTMVKGDDDSIYFWKNLAKKSIIDDENIIIKEENNLKEVKTRLEFSRKNIYKKI